MGLKEDLESEVEAIFKEQWTTRDGTKVPESEDLKLSNDAVNLEGTVLYADISGSTKLVDSRKTRFAAEIYKTYLHCAAKIIRAEGGAITAYDGDRVMAVYIGDFKNTSAVRTALKINWARANIINPKLKKQYPNETYAVQSTVGIDTTKLFIARTGIRGSNDLVWVGRAANYTAKLSSLAPEYATYITTAVHGNIHESVKITNGQSMWKALTWTQMNNITIYGSTWGWPL